MNILNTRDLEKEIDDLTETEEEYQELFDEYFITMSAAEAAQKACDESGLDHDDRHRLNALRAFREDLEGYCDWQHGDMLIHENYREQYARECAEEIPDQWPFQYIDWEAAADDLFRHDYVYSDLEGETYYARCS